MYRPSSHVCSSAGVFPADWMLKKDYLSCRYHAPELGQHPCVRRIRLTEVGLPFDYSLWPDGEAGRTTAKSMPTLEAFIPSLVSQSVSIIMGAVLIRRRKRLRWMWKWSSTILSWQHMEAGLHQGTTLSTSDSLFDTKLRSQPETVRVSAEIDSE